MVPPNGPGVKLPRKLDDRDGVGALGDEIAEQEYLIAISEIGEPKQGLELGDAAVDIADDDEAGDAVAQPGEMRV